MVLPKTNETQNEKGDGVGVDGFGLNGRLANSCLLVIFAAEGKMPPQHKTC